MNSVNKTSFYTSSYFFPPVVDKLVEFFQYRGIQGFLVGGVVRDAILNRATSDVDIALIGDVRNIGTDLAGFLAGRCVVLDSSRDMARVFVSSETGGGFVDLSPLNRDIQFDLGFRDFTIDSMAVPISSSLKDKSGFDLIDPTDGLVDLRAGVIRAVSWQALESDPLRLIRAVRLASQLDFKIDEKTTEWIRGRANLIWEVAPERIREELLKVISTSIPARALRILDDLDLLCGIIPELSGTKGVTQPKEHYWDVFNHSIETTEKLRLLLDRQLNTNAHMDAIYQRKYFEEEISDGHSRTTMLVLASLLHDIGKPTTKSVERNGRVRFLGHANVGVDLTTKIMKRLRFSRRGIDFVSKIVEHHLRPGQLAAKGMIPTKRAIYRYYRDLGDVAVDTVYLNLADYLAAKGPIMDSDEWIKHCEIAWHILKFQSETDAIQTSGRLIDGNDIMEILSITQGPDVGRLLEAVQEATASGEISSRDEALEFVDLFSKGRLINA